VALQPPADTLVHALKYEGWRGLADEMGATMAQVSLPRNVLRDQAVLVPIPTTTERLRGRGYNQAHELANGVARRLRMPVVEALIRTRSGPTQVALHPSERWANVRGAFAPRDGSLGLPEGVHAILVDDVLTTGSTAAAAAAVLAGLGVSSVTLLTFARALPDRVRTAA
jgi:ComF family protein